jgi:hypothetical protein
VQLSLRASHSSNTASQRLRRRAVDHARAVQRVVARVVAAAVDHVRRLAAPPLAQADEADRRRGYISLCAQIAEKATIDWFGPTPAGAA